MNPVDLSASLFGTTMIPAGEPNETDIVHFQMLTDAFGDT
jgi:hypothetical protein